MEHLLDALRGGRHFLVLSHQNPEGDALGSTLALGTGLKNIGKTVHLFNQDAVPQTFKNLPGAGEISASIPASARFDAICVVDCGDRNLLGATYTRWEEAQKDIPPVLVMDHHQTNAGFGRWNVVDADASSAGEIVLKILKLLPAPITGDIATQIYTAIITDTGAFRYSNTREETFQAAAELVRCGADPWKIAREIYEREPVRRLRLLSLVLGTLEIADDGSVASLTVLKDMYTATGTTKEDMEEFVNYARSIDGVEVGFLVREMDGASFRTSLRSSGRVDVSAVAREFGGGGHHNAAGCTVPGTADEAKAAIMAAIRRHRAGR